MDVIRDIRTIRDIRVKGCIPLSSTGYPRPDFLLLPRGELCDTIQMKIRFYMDESGQPHIYKHAVTELKAFRRRMKKRHGQK